MVEAHFATTPPPRVSTLASLFGLSVSAGGPLEKLVNTLLRHEKRFAAVYQAKAVVGGRVLRFSRLTFAAGLLEADGTSLRHWHGADEDINYVQVFGLVTRAASEDR